MQYARNAHFLSCLKMTSHVAGTEDSACCLRNDAKAQNRIFTGYDLFLDEKPFNGSLELLLESNSEADKNHVSKNMRERITEALRKAFMLANPDYREPGGQLSLKFGE